MSVDPWGGGTDRDPKLRLREFHEREQLKSLPPLAREPKQRRISLLEALVLAVLAVAAVIGASSLF